MSNYIPYKRTDVITYPRHHNLTHREAAERKAAFPVPVPEQGWLAQLNSNFALTHSSRCCCGHKIRPIVTRAQQISSQPILAEVSQTNPYTSQPKPGRALSIIRV